MDKVTYDMLDEFGSVVKGTYRMLYPSGLTMDELGAKAQEFNWLRIIYCRFKDGE